MEEVVFIFCWSGNILPYQTSANQGPNQISANNLTLLCYSKKLGIQVLFGVKYHIESGVITQTEL